MRGKVFAIPTIVAGTTAGLSVLFFIGLSHVFGDRVLGHIIFVQATAALLQIALVPQGWVYIIASKDDAMMRLRYSEVLTIELAGIAAGFALLSAALQLPFAFIAPLRDGAQFMFLSLVVQALSSCLGWLRATESWRRYALWSLLPNLIRVPLIWLTPALFSGQSSSIATHRATIILIYFLLPDLFRLVVVALPIAWSNYRWPGFRTTAAAARIILRNWLFDMGSAINDSADKVIVGSMLGPTVLVAYFFARRMGIIATMITEPYYAEHYRRTVRIIGDVARASAQRRIYGNGVVSSVGLYILVISGIVLASHLPRMSTVIPPAVISYIWLFASILLIDCLLAANRWSRYIAQLNGGSARLLAVRLSVFMLFVLNVSLLTRVSPSIGLAIAFFLSWLLEASYIVYQLVVARSRSIFAAAPLGQIAVEQAVN